VGSLFRPGYKISYFCTLSIPQFVDVLRGRCVCVLVDVLAGCRRVKNDPIAPLSTRWTCMYIASFPGRIKRTAPRPLLHACVLAVMLSHGASVRSRIGRIKRTMFTMQNQITWTVTALARRLRPLSHWPH